MPELGFEPRSAFIRDVSTHIILRGNAVILQGYWGKLWVLDNKMENLCQGGMCVHQSNKTGTILREGKGSFLWEL